MKIPSGFVPVPFHRVGKVLLIIGGIGVISLLVSKLIVGFSLPNKIMFISFSLIGIGLYLVFVVPRDNER